MNKIDLIRFGNGMDLDIAYFVQSLLSKYLLALSTTWAILSYSFAWVFGRFSISCAYDAVSLPTFIFDVDIVISNL